MPSPTLLGAIRARGESLFRVWAPQARAVEVVFEDASAQPLALKRESGGYLSGATSACVSGRATTTKRSQPRSRS